MRRFLIWKLSKSVILRFLIDFRLINVKCNIEILFLLKTLQNYLLTLSRLRLLSYRNQSIDLLCKSMDRFLCDNGLRLERVNLPSLQIRKSLSTVNEPIFPYLTAAISSSNIAPSELLIMVRSTITLPFLIKRGKQMKILWWQQLLRFNIQNYINPFSQFNIPNHDHRHILKPIDDFEVSVAIAEISMWGCMLNFKPGTKFRENPENVRPGLWILLDPDNMR